MPESAQRFLVVRLSSIGDIVHALPAVASLGETFPSADIEWVVEARFAQLLEGNPFVKRVVRIDTTQLRRRSRRAQAAEDLMRSILALRERPFDVAIDFQGLYKSGLIAWLSRAPIRLGFADPWLREPGVGILYTERIRPRGRRHVVDMNMALVEHVGARSSRWRFPLPGTNEGDQDLDKRLAALGDGDFVVISPGGGWRSKRWAPENYADLIRRLERDLPWRILLTGSQDEELLIQAILERAGSRLATYFPTTLVGFIALARRARLFVGGDSGPLHLAAAIGTPIVALYGVTDLLNTAERNGPFSPSDIVLVGAKSMSYLWRGRSEFYLEGIAVEGVLAAIHRRVAGANGSSVR